jgi:putative NADPH-quinone reductase
MNYNSNGMKIYVLLGHPSKKGFNGKIYEAYCKAATDAGHQVKTQCLGDLKFDPVFWGTKGDIQELEPDLKTAQEYIAWCEKWVIIYPMWWGSVPALLKGFFDRTLLSGFAFKYHKNDPFWDKLLKGKKAQVITTCDAPAWYVRLKYRNCDLRMLKTVVLGYCGIKPVKVKRIGSLRAKSEKQKELILKEVSKLAQ